MVQLSFDPALPITAHLDEIEQLLWAHQVVVVAGETGSGKTTQLPKLCLRMGRQHIGHTQPRRIAARSVAERIASEMGVPLGEQVGYQVRFTRRAGARTQLKVMTDGVLLAEINQDRDLRRYDTIILDEAHERSLTIDFLLGYLKTLLPRRPDLKLIITSATIDTARFAQHFNDAPVVQVSGRSYPVDIRYRPLHNPEDGRSADLDQPEAIAAAIRELMGAGPGDILVFLSGEREIRDAAEALRGAELGVDVLPLYARLSAAEQHRIFQPHSGRRVVLATNIAETSLTVPGIRYVVDTGWARISRYSARSKVQRLPIEPISRASADQRAGRCGRLGPGICIRLYPEEDYLGRPEYTQPEILRTNLASVILQMAQADLGDIATFPFLDAPDPAQVNDGLRLLSELGALQSTDRRHPRLTKIGHQLAKLPVDPRLARMLVEAAHRGCLREVLVIVSGLAVQDVREWPVDQRAQADQAHRRFWSDAVLADVNQPASAREELGRPAQMAAMGGTTPDHEPPSTISARAMGGDVLALLRLWSYLVRRRRQLSGNQFRRLCRAEYINYLRVREWQDLHTQLVQICADLGLVGNRQAGNIEQVLISVLSGLLSQIGLADLPPSTPARHGGQRSHRRPQLTYRGARGVRFTIQPGSALYAKPPELVMAVELVQTSQLWARTVAGIRPEWVEEVGAHLLKRNYSDPHWSSSAGAVLAYEKTTLLGVPIVADRLVNYAGVDPAGAHEIFLRSALIAGEWTPDPADPIHDFLRHNAAAITQAEEVEDRLRQRGLVASEEAIYDFYAARIPEHISSVAGFDAWWRTQPDRHLLDLDPDSLVADHAPAGEFPDEWRVDVDGRELRLPVSYVFEPGAGRDGVTVSVPLAQLNQIPEEPFSWQVPGLRQELATDLIRGLPKTIRREFAPAPDHAGAALRWLADHGADQKRWFHSELGRALEALTGVNVPPGEWALADVPAHLRVGFEVTSGEDVVGYAKSLAELRDRLGGQLNRALARAAGERAPRAWTSWSFGPIPEQVDLTAEGVAVVAYPALRDTGIAVQQVMCDSLESARHNQALGVRRLLVLTNPDPTKWAVAHLSNAQKLALAASPYPSMAELLADARLKTVDRLARQVADPEQVRDEDAYQRLAEYVRTRQADQMREVLTTAADALAAASRLTGELTNGPANTVADLRDELANLVFDRFISYTRDPWYGHLPRYLAAMEARLASARLDPDRDARLAAPIHELQAEYDRLCAAVPAGRVPDALDDIGFLLEEFRVQTFAQRLGTSLPVSAKRIRRALAEIGTG